MLPPRIVAGRPATLAALGVDGKLASGVKVDVGDQQLTTDSTGRAIFSAPASAGYVLAKASGSSFATLVDPPAGDPSPTISVAPVISLHDQFSICGTALSGRADGNLVKINGQLSLVLAASPECIVVLPGPKVEAGPGDDFRGNGRRAIHREDVDRRARIRSAESGAPARQERRSPGSRARVRRETAAGGR